MRRAHALLVTTLTLVVIACGGESDGTHALALEGVSRLSLASGTCAPPFDACARDTTREVDFVGKKLELHACREVGKGKRPVDDVTSRPLSDAQLDEVRASLQNVRVRTATSANSDGLITGITLTTGAGANRYTVAGECSPADYQQIVSGLEALRATLDAL
jgi:hypothetical protein